MRTGHNEQAIEWMEATPREGVFLSFPYLDYMLGVARLRRLDPAGARHLQAFLAHTRGRHYIKEAYQKLAWAALLRDDEAGYQANMKLVAARGSASAGGDKNALKEARSGIRPLLVLLKPRLLFDGGYYQRAYNAVASYRTIHFSTGLQQLEFRYRKGRILHGLAQYDAALEEYRATIALGKDYTAFYACNAALQAGLIEEQRGNSRQARQYFEQCLTLNPDDYRTGLHHQAKAGLSRLAD
jgi:tetratricopeptide (TPR) repeat protein